MRVLIRHIAEKWWGKDPQIPSRPERWVRGRGQQRQSYGKGQKRRRSFISGLGRSQVSGTLGREWGRASRGENNESIINKS